MKGLLRACDGLRQPLDSEREEATARRPKPGRTVAPQGETRQRLAVPSGYSLNQSTQDCNGSAKILSGCKCNARSELVNRANEFWKSILRTTHRPARFANGFQSRRCLSGTGTISSGASVLLAMCPHAGQAISDARTAFRISRTLPFPSCFLRY